MLRAGQTLLLPKPGQDVSHLWVVLFAADPVTSETVIVNLISLRDHSDQTLLLQAGEHPFIRHSTVVHYADARIVGGRALAAALAAGTFPSHNDCSAQLLEKMRQGLIASPFTARKVKDYARRRLSAP